MNIPMQLTFSFSASQVSWFRDVFNLLLLPFLSWLVSRTRKMLNTVITENSNRNRDELTVVIDRKFTEHESTAFSRITELEKSVAEIRRLIEKHHE